MTSIKWLAEALHLHSIKSKYLLMLKAYIDESGHSSDPRCRFVGMGGLVAPSENWETFTERWVTILKEYIGVAPFHMKEFVMVPGIGPYKGWKENRRREFLGQLVQTILGSGAQYVGCVVSMDGFNLLHPHHRSMFIDPYYLAFQQVTHGCSICGMSVDGPFVGEKVAMVYAYQNDFGAIESGSEHTRNQGRAEQLWHAMKATNTLTSQWMGAYASELAKNIPALQAADLFAYEITKEFENRLNRPGDDMRWALRQMLANDQRQALIKFLSFEGILEILMNDKKIEENLDIRIASSMIQLNVKMAMAGRASK